MSGFFGWMRLVEVMNLGSLLYSEKELLLFEINEAPVRFSVLTESM